MDILGGYASAVSKQILQVNTPFTAFQNMFQSLQDVQTFAPLQNKKWKIQAMVSQDVGEFHGISKRKRCWMSCQSRLFIVDMFTYQSRNCSNSRWFPEADDMFKNELNT